MENNLQDKNDVPGPPPALDDEYFKWMVGEWEGTTESPMGTSTDRMNCHMGLGDQFLLIDFESEIDGGSDYAAKGFMSLSPNGEVVGYFFDSWRTMAQGLGRRDGKVLTMEWEDVSGKQTRITEMVGDDHRKETIKMTGPDGQAMEAVSEMTRMRSKE